MRDRYKTKEQLIDELKEMRQKVSTMEAAEGRLLGKEKALRESEERFRLFYENAPLGYQSLDENGHFLEVNRAWLDTLGYDREEVIGRWFGDFLAPGYQDHFKINFPKFKAAGEIHWVEFEMIRKDGSQISVAFDGQIGHDEQGRFRQTHCILHDISEIKRSQDALKESEQRYKAVVDNIEVGISVLNSNMEIIEVNKALRRYFPHVRPASGQICYEHYNDPPRSEPCSYCPCVLTLQDGEVHEAITETPAGSEIRYYHLVSSPIKDSDGRVQYVIELTEDITERKKAQEGLYRANQEWKQTFNAISDFVLVLDDQHKILRANKAMADALGMTELELIGELCFKLVHGEKEPPVFCPHSQLLADGAEHSAEVVEPRLGGIYDVRVSPLVDQNGQTMASVHVIRDITERKQAEEKIKQAEEFLNSVVDSLPIAVFAKAAQNGQFVLWNKASEALFGFTKEQVIGKTDYDFFPKEQADFFCEKDKESFASGEAIDIPEEPVLTKNLGARLLHTKKVPVYDKERQPFCLLGISQDITDPKRAEDIMLTRLRLVEYATSHSLDELLQATLDEVEVLTDSLIGFYHFLEADQRTVRLQAWSTRTLREMCTAEGKGLHYDIDEAGVWVDCVHERKPVIHNDYSALPHRKGMPPGHANVIRELVVPVFRGERIVAVLGVGNKPVDYAAIDIETVSLLADLAWDIAERKLADENLCRSEAKFLDLYENAPCAYFSVGTDAIIRLCNRRAGELLGYSREELIGKPVFELYVDKPEGREKAGKVLKRFLAGELIADEELQMQKADGSPLWISLTVNGVRDTDGHLVESRSMVLDISERRRAEEALHRLNRELRAISNCNQILLRAVDEETLVNDVCSIICDEAGYRLAWVGYAENDIAKTVRPVAWAGFHSEYVANAKLTWADDTERGWGPAGKAIRSGETVYVQDIAIDPQMAPWRENALQHGYRSGIALPLKDESAKVFGVLLIYHSEPNAMTLDEIRLMEGLAGDLAFGINTLRTRAERKRAEEALRESEAFYRSLYENISDCIFIIDVTPEERFKFVGFNPAEERAVGMTTEQVANRFTDDLVPKDVAEHINSRYQMCVEKRKTIHYEEVLDLPKGKMSFLTSLVPFEGPDGRIYRIVGVARDITEQKSLQRQLLQAQKMEAVGTLAGGIAHDFNNILQVVLGFSEMLIMDKGEGDKEREDIQKILSAARKGAALVKGLLTFSRKTEINPKPLNLNQVIHQGETILARTLPKTIKVNLMLQERLSAINADPVQIEQILLNLAINARDAMPEGGRLTFETSNVSLDETYCREHLGAEPGDYVLLMVSDTGEGMTKQTLEHIFEPFFSTKPAGEGTGLGLAMVYGIVKQHSGLIMCYSEPGVGTTFKLYFPVIEMQDETRVREEVVRFPGGIETVLLVDDEDLVRELGKRILSRAGYTVLAATNGREALQVYKKERERISLVILDLIMPEMDGKHCLKELLKVNPGAKVLVASGYSANGPTKEALEIGARGFVSKPFDMGQLLRTVRKALDA